MKLVIVGGVAGGASAAARSRRLDEHAEIVLLERGEQPSFANCGMPYYIGGEIATRESLLVAPEERLRRRYRLEVRTQAEVLVIDRPRRQLRVRELTSGHEYDESYDRLILATGATPIRPRMEGVELPGIYTLRDLSDADRLYQAATSGHRSVVIVGAGFIGIEMAENLVRRGLHVTLVEQADQILPVWDPEMTADLAAQLQTHGIQLRLSDAALGFRLDSGQLTVELRSGAAVSADFVVLCLGVRPESRLAVDAGLEVGARGGVRVNRHMQTSDPLIYAVGDVAEVSDVVSGTPVHIPLAGPANRQGRIAADHIFGRRSAYRGTQGTAIVGAFGMAVASTGLTEKLLRRLGLPHEKIYVHPGHIASYYPGAQRMTLKLLFDPQGGQLLGAQAAGRSGVDKRIDVLSVAIQARMTVFDLEELELCYAPQFGAAKDPVNMAGFVAANWLRGDHPLFHPPDADAADVPEMALLDVRTPEEFSRGHIPGAQLIPLDELRERLAEVPSTQPVLTYCEVGQRGYLATRLLCHHGIDARNLSGGFTSWRQRGGKVRRAEDSA